MGKLSRLKTQGQRNRTSKGEKDLFSILKQMYPLATFWTEYPLSRIIEDCNNDKLKVDIYCSTFGIIWEYDGNFHYNSIPFSNEEEDVFAAKKALEEQKQRDSYKDSLCRDAGIKLVRIPHFEWEKLESDKEKIEYLRKKL